MDTTPWLNVYGERSRRVVKKRNGSRDPEEGHPSIGRKPKSLEEALADAGASPNLLDKLALWRTGKYLRRLLALFVKEAGMADQPLITQSSALPTRKVAAFATGGAAATILIAVARRVFDMELPAEVADALVLVIGFVVAYMTRERGAALRLKGE